MGPVFPRFPICDEGYPHREGRTAGQSQRLPQGLPGRATHSVDRREFRAERDRHATAPAAR